MAPRGGMRDRPVGEVSDENLFTLESEPDNEEAIAAIFRAFHTIKGTT